MTHFFPTPERALRLNYDRVASSTLHPAIKRVCATIQRTLYVTIGEFLSGLSESELIELESFCDIIHAGDVCHPKFTRASKEIEALTLALMASECSVLTIPAEVARCSALMVTFIALEALRRDGKLDLHHNQLAFVADTNTVLAVLSENV